MFSRAGPCCLALCLACGWGLAAAHDDEKGSTLPAKTERRLYTDAEIRRRVKHDIEKTAPRPRSLFGNYPPLGIIPEGETRRRSQVFKALRIDPGRLGESKSMIIHRGVFHFWAISPSYTLLFCSSIDDPADADPKVSKASIIIGRPLVLR